MSDKDKLTLEVEKARKILIITDDDNLKKVLQFCFDGWGYEVFFEGSHSPRIASIVKVSPDVIIVDAHSATESQLEICGILKRDFSTAHIPVITLIDKKQLRHQLLDFSQGVDDYLIKPPDPLELKIRIEMVVKRSQESFYASPLTGLPGGTVVEDMLKRRLDSGSSFVVGHVDIDNFKSFNDKYGYLKGDRVIMQTAYMLATTVRTWGNKGDFLGHIGGDDFVIITTPDKYNELCKNFICMFDTIIPFHYEEPFRKQGYMIAKDRSNRVKKIPIMSVTIALVMKSNPAEVNSLIEMNERIAEVKQYLKKMPGSKYMADRRVLERNEHLSVQMFKNDESILKSYKPLGQILLDKNIITREELDKALKAHWKRGVRLGEVLKDMGFLSEEDLSNALRGQELNLGSV